jgi:general stress protein 26
MLLLDRGLPHVSRPASPGTVAIISPPRASLTQQGQFIAVIGDIPMPVPRTALDRRYSAPDATAASWEQTARVLETSELFWISTVRADGRPHVTPVVAAWWDEAIWFTTGAEEQKYVNMRANPHVVLTTGCHRWDQGLDVVVEGDAVRITDDATLAQTAKAFLAKWDGRWQFTARDGCFRDLDGNGEAMVFAVRPVKVFAHAKGDPFGATTHRFRAG